MLNTEPTENTEHTERRETVLDQSKLVRRWDGESHFRSIGGDFGEGIPANSLKTGRLSEGNLGPESCVL